jgi:hypothetical protein
MTISKPISLNEGELLISELLKLGSESYLHEYNLSFVQDFGGWGVMLSKHSGGSSFFYHLYTSKGRLCKFSTLDAAYEAVKSVLDNVQVRFICLT